MEHQLVTDIEKALGWSGPQLLGSTFARGPLPEPELASRLLTPTGLLDLVMRRSLTMDGLRILVDGVDLHPRAYLGRSPARRGLPVPMADMGRIGQLLHHGCTLILDMADLFEPTLEVACRALQWWTRELVQVNLYLTTGEAAGFELHWDDHDVLVVQLAGEKSWEVRSTSRAVPMYRDAAPNPTPPDKVLWSGTMQAGDVMHIPRGHWHQATRQQRGPGYSLHATFGFTKQTGVHWLRWLTDQARAEETFRRDLDRWGSADERAEQQHTLFDRADCLLTAHSTGDFLLVRDQRQPSARHVAAHGAFGPPSSVVCVSEFPPDIAVHGALMTVRTAGKEITLDAKALPAVRLLLCGEPVDVVEVSQATEVDAGLLADMFLAEGVCGEVTPALAAGYAGWVS